jgi:hypothetical protein
MDAPDSPPDFTPGSDIYQAASRSATQPFRDASQAQQANTGIRVNGETKIHFGAPGSSWQTKKFSEEFERAESGLLDKQWSACE